MASHEQRLPGDSQVTNGPCWIIREDHGAGESWILLTVELEELGTILPVFGGREPALGFMKDFITHSPGTGPRFQPEAVQMARARLASALLDPLSDVERVVFVPSVLSSDEDFRRLVERDSLRRGSFVDAVLGRGRAWSAREGQKQTSRIRRGAAIKL